MIKTVTLRILGVKQRNLIKFMCKTSCSAFPPVNNLLFSWLNVVFMARFKAKCVAGCGLKSINVERYFPTLLQLADDGTQRSKRGWWKP